MNAASCYRLDFCSLVCDNDDQRLRHEQPKAGNGHDEAADGWKNQQAVSERQRCRSSRTLYVGMHHLSKEEYKDAANQKPEWECLIVISHRCVYQSVLNDFQQCFFFIAIAAIVCNIPVAMRNMPLYFHAFIILCFYVVWRLISLLTTNKGVIIENGKTITLAFFEGRLLWMRHLWSDSLFVGIMPF